MEFIVYGLLIVIIMLAVFSHRNHKNTKELNNTLTRYQKELERLNEKIETAAEERIESQKQIDSYATEIKKLSTSLEEAKAKIDFYTNIEEASAHLNSGQDSEKENQLLVQVTEQIKIEGSRQASSETLANPNPDKTKSLLDTEQALAREKMEHTQENFFITGKAGTGKSFLLDVFRRTTKKCILFLLQQVSLP